MYLPQQKASNFNLMKSLKHALILFFLIALLNSCGSKKHKTYTQKTYKSSKTSSTPTHKETKNSGKTYTVINEARNYFGTKYRYGGTDKRGIDCSGLMCAAYQSIGVELPRTSGEQSTIGKRVYIGELQPGDLVFFGTSPNSKKITHVGLISDVSMSSIKFIHASTRAGVVESELLSNWYKPRYIMAVRPLK